MLVLTRKDVESALEVAPLVEAVAKAMVDLSGGRASMPPRMAAMVAETDGFLTSMPAYLPSLGALTTKLVSLFPKNQDRPTHQALICCFDPSNGSPLALMDGTYITAMRTAAGSSIATRLLARPAATAVAILGTGTQARSHIAVFAAMSQATEFLLAGRDPQAAEALAASLSELHGVPVVPVASVRDAVARADIVCATTSASTSVVTRDAVRAGTHINSVGFNPAGDGEVDPETIRDAVVVVETRAAALAPPPTGAIELQRAFEAGVIASDHVHAELGELLDGTRSGRTDDAQVTLYKSVGVAVQDAAAAAQVLATARARGIGIELDL